ncbi:hypothetical protein SAMN04487949_2854 [Halogranum gelatinilyticum]|uniref:Uncharacterized protein n=1 Tax=Halogranum gelatinilyticum TaxID=660521 RepID=A0A1G9X6M6_9EURY|nr:hypothetical protein [Halogranum gelatinilyticum]SDM92166.1 hypothetical protein SAMN04487949_2854 [Halogranum gelatinilyticum]
MTDIERENDHGRVATSERIAAAFETSSVLGVARRAFGEHSRSNAVGRWMLRAVEQSFVYRWLTKEPNPEVIVIDLRETYTVGPFVRLVDSIVDAATPYWHGSGLKRALDRTEHVFKRAAETRVGRQLAALFAPPEPRGERDGDEDDGR